MKLKSLTLTDQQENMTPSEQQDKCSLIYLLFILPYSFEHEMISLS